MPRPARSSGLAATRSRRGITSLASRSRTDACTSARTTARSGASVCRAQDGSSKGSLRTRWGMVMRPMVFGKLFAAAVIAAVAVAAISIRAGAVDQGTAPQGAVQGAAPAQGAPPGGRGGGFRQPAPLAFEYHEGWTQIF